MDTAKPKLLLVEDDRDNQNFFNTLLKKYFELDICDSADGFYILFSKNEYDIIIMDISLRGNKNGLDLIRELRQKEQYKYLPILCLTAHAFTRDRENAINAGASDYLSKPVSNQVLLNKLFSLLDKAPMAANF